MKPTNHSDKLYRVIGVSILVLTFVVFGIWAGLAPLKSAVVTQGKISLTTQNQSVQHIEGGLVESLLVRDGDQVKAGQPLLALDTTQTKKQMQAAEQQIDSLKQRIASRTEDLKGLRELVEEQLVSKAQVRETERVISQLEAQVAALRSDISRLKERIDRSIVRAPLSGKVKGLTLTTIGAVVQPGDTLMEIVPSADAIEIIARISPTDIDVVQIGMTAETRFSALDGAQDMPTMFATLTDASTDVFEDERGQGSYYKAKLQVNPEAISYLQQGEQQLVSGMPVDVMITTGERTLLQYLLSPLMDTFNKAFNEA